MHVLKRTLIEVSDRIRCFKSYTVGNGDSLDECQVARENCKSEFFEGVNSTILFLWKDKAIHFKDPDPQSRIVYPDQVWEQLNKLFIDQFDVESISDEEKINHINLVMENQEIHFVFEVPKKENQYEIKAALILEHKIQFQEEGETYHQSYSIFHLIANTLGYNNVHYVDKLLNNAIYSRDICERRMFFFTQLG